MSKDMTRGNPLGLILKFFIPVLLGSVFQQFYSMVDTIVVGKFVGVNALAGVGATGSINFLILGFAMGITIGFGVKVGQRFGAKDYEGMRNYMANGFYLIVIISAIMTPLTMYFCKDILELTGTPEEIFSDSYNYLIWILADRNDTISLSNDLPPHLSAVKNLLCQNITQEVFFIHAVFFCKYIIFYDFLPAAGF